MRILIDTNILIHLEDNKIVKTFFSKFYKLAIENQCKILYHPIVLNDIENDKDLERKKIILSKLSKYSTLENPAIPTREFIDLVGEKKSNDRMDNAQLFQVYKCYVEYLITEDYGILKKANKASIKEKVLNIQDALKLLEETFSFVIPSHPVLKEGSVRQILKYKDDLFFNSLKADYPGFSNWLDKCAAKDRRAFYLIINKIISAILIYNKETPYEHKLPNIHTDVLKICTFKVSENTFGYKIGELFLGKIFSLAIEMKVDYVYLTVFPKHVQLIQLLKDFGFSLNSFESKEYYMIKDIKKPKGITELLKNHITIHPYYFDSPEIKKFIIPIEEQFYSKLFKDAVDRMPMLFDDDVREIQGNTIRKAYICNSRVQLNSGDIILFYISETLMKIEPVCIVDSYHKVNNFDELKMLVRKRTVYPEKDLENMLQKSKSALTVVLFRLVFYMKKPILYKELKELESCKNNLITITNLSESDYILLKNKGHFDERFIVN